MDFVNTLREAGYTNRALVEGLILWERLGHEGSIFEAVPRFTEGKEVLDHLRPASTAASS